MELRTVRITRKGQVTMPKRIRDFLKSDVVEFSVIDNKVVVPYESAIRLLSIVGYIVIDRHLQNVLLIL
jgi:bifunctional DNA-binding transcriptional regulator/antitoxin component of YhaV-PrlF toxin-antitoxin module